MKNKWFGLTSVLLIVMLLVVACGATNEAPEGRGTGNAGSWWRH